MRCGMRHHESGLSSSCKKKYDFCTGVSPYRKNPAVRPRRAASGRTRRPAPNRSLRPAQAQDYQEHSERDQHLIVDNETLLQYCLTN